MKKPGFLSAMWVGLALVAGGVQAHDDAYLDTVKTAHGGQLRMAGMYHFELVVEKSAKGARDNPVVVYVTYHAGTSIPTAGSSGTATLLAGKDKTVVTLAPDGDNRMKGSGKYASATGLKAVVSITLAGKAAEQARFTPLAAMADEHMEHKH